MQALTRVLRAGEPAAQRPAPWRVRLSAALALIGLAMSTYLTVIHFTLKYVPGCVQGSVINCQQVLNSPQSHVFGIPVAVLGLAFYLVLVPLCSPWAWRAADRRFHLARLGLVVVGMGFVLYLISAELLDIKAICEFCTVVHVVTFAQLILVVATVPAMLGWTGAVPEPAPNRRRQQAARSRRPAPGDRNGRSSNRPVTPGRSPRR